MAQVSELSVNILPSDPFKQSSTACMINGGMSALCIAITEVQLCL